MASATSPVRPGDTRSQRGLWSRPATAVVVIVVASSAVALLAPDLVTGSAHEHLSLGALTIWPWTAAAVGYVVAAGRGNGSRDLVLGVVFTWFVVAVLAVAAPTLVTGTDPTRIPLASLIAPPFGAVVTGFLAIAHARGSSGGG